MLVTDAPALARLEKTLAQLFQERKKKVSPALSPGWVAGCVAALTVAIAHRSREGMLAAVRDIARDLNLPMPSTGAFWSDPKVGQEQARRDLAAQGGRVLADTPIAQIKWGVAPQGATSRGGTVTESASEFQERNAVALMFWGALSALYAEGLSGAVHVWLPKGLTMSSIFWNDELPVLWDRMRAGAITGLFFHVLRQDGGGWSAAIPFRDLTIVDAYLVDADGVNQGARHVRGTLDPTRYQLALAAPIHVNALQSGFRQALERARIRIRAQRTEAVASRLTEIGLARRAAKASGASSGGASSTTTTTTTSTSS